MSVPKPLENVPIEAGAESTLHRIRQLRCFGTTTVEAVGFWLAVTLPVPTLGLLATGVSTPTELFGVAGLLTANLLAFFLGHDHSRADPTPKPTTD